MEARIFSPIKESLSVSSRLYVFVAISISKLILPSQDLLSQGTITVRGYNFDLVLSESEAFGGKGVVAPRPPGSYCSKRNRLLITFLVVDFSKIIS